MNVILPSESFLRTKDYIIGQQIGSGSFSVVYRAMKVSSKQEFAIKIFPKSNLQSTGDEERFQREVDAMAYLHYDNLVALHDLLWDSNNFYLVMDYCTGGELYDYIVQHGKLNEPISALLFKQIVGAVAYCHSYGVAHRDLKPENILIADFPVVKVTDFGLCGFIDDQKLMQTFVGSPSYCSPECLCKIQYDGRASDIWSLGVILYTMVTGEHPWNVSNTSLMLRQIMKANFTVPSYVSPECKDLICSLMKVKPKERLSMQGIIAHPWLKCSEWALIQPPSNIDFALSTMRLQQPITLAQISSSSSRSSHQSDCGIISPFDNDDIKEISEIEDRLTLSEFRLSSLPNFRQICGSIDQNTGADPNRRRFVPSSASMNGKKRGLLVQSSVPNLMQVIAEIE